MLCSPRGSAAGVVAKARLVETRIAGLVSVNIWFYDFWDKWGLKKKSKKINSRLRTTRWATRAMRVGKRKAVWVEVEMLL